MYSGSTAVTVNGILVQRQGEKRPGEVDRAEPVTTAGARAAGAGSAAPLSRRAGVRRQAAPHVVAGIDWNPRGSKSYLFSRMFDFSFN